MLTNQTFIDLLKKYTNNQLLVDAVNTLYYIFQQSRNPEKKEYTILIWAILHQSKLLIIELLKDIVDIDETENSEKTALLIAVEENHGQIAELLLKKGANINHADCLGNTPLITSITSDDKGWTRSMLLDYKPDLNKQNFLGDTAVNCAAWHGYYNITKDLINKGADIFIKDKKGKYVIPYVEQWKNKTERNEVMHLIMKKNINIFIEELEYYSDDDKKLKKTIERCKDLIQTPNKKDNNETPLCWAACQGKCLIMKYFIEIGKINDLNLQDTCGHFTLISAAQFNQLEMVELLLKFNAHTNVKDTNGCSAIDKAMENQNYDVVAVLLKHGAQHAKIHTEQDLIKFISDEIYNLWDYEDQICKILDKINNVKLLSHVSRVYGTIIHKAVQKNYIKMLDALIEKGVNLNVQDVDGNTPLNWAIIWNQPEMVKKLLEHNVHRRDAIAVALYDKYHKHEEILKMLYEYSQK